MTRAALIERLRGRFEADFATQTAAEVLAADAVGLLYEVATAQCAELQRAICRAELPSAPLRVGASRVAQGAKLSRVTRHQILFRSAYVLEKIYFADPEQFRPYVDRFLKTDFVACTDASARRHFAKIMADLLTYERPETACLERIAEIASDWAVAEDSKIAVRIWAVEILKSCRRIPWVAELWPDLLEAMSHDASPGILRRMRSWR